MKLVAALVARDAARTAAYFRFGLLQAPEAPVLSYGQPGCLGRRARYRLATGLP